MRLNSPVSTPVAAPALSPHGGDQSPSRKFRGVLVGLIICILALPVLIVLIFFHPWRPDVPRGLCAIGVDYGGSTAPMIASYKAWALQEAIACSADGTADIQIFPVTTATEFDYQSASRQVTFTADELRDAGNEDDQRTLIHDEIKAALDGAFQSWADQPATFKGGTSVVGAAMLAEQYMKNVAGARTLILFTDGVEGKEFNFSKIPTDPVKISGMLQGLQDTGRLAGLDGVTVRMYGGGAGRFAPNMKPAQLTAVQTFWTKYFVAAKTESFVYAKQPG